MAEIVVTQGFNGGIVPAKKGDTLKVQLPENPTTGYRWAVDTPGSTALALTEDDYQPAGEGIGGGGFRILRFAATGLGSANLQCKLSRSWQSGPPAALFSVRVTVT